jgi:hypothetical protein
MGRRRRLQIETLDVADGRIAAVDGVLPVAAELDG